MEVISKRSAAGPRLADMWTLLLWEGELRNARLQEVFGVTSVQCSRLLSIFRETHPEALHPITSDKAWPLRDSSSAPAGARNMAEYLRLVGDHNGSVSPWLVDARTEHLRIHPEFVAPIRAACLAGTGVTARYSSMSNPDGKVRLLFPHSVVRLNQRWHMRAWCEDRQQYRDFNLGRLSNLRPSNQLATHGRDADQDWNLHVDLVLRAHRGLSAEQAKALRNEYFKGAAQARVQVRAALVQYVIQEYRAAMDPVREKPPAFQLEVGNPEELSKYAFGRE